MQTMFYDPKTNRYPYPEDTDKHYLHVKKDDGVVFTGTVEDKLPNTMFRVKLDNGHEILATVCGKMRKNRIWVNVGERVRVEMTPYDLAKGRITFVERKRAPGESTEQ